MTPSRSARYRDAIWSSAFALGVNLLLAAIKLAGGLFGHSFALLSDAANSLSDVLVSGVVLVALRAAQKPADAEHPYGHTRIEAVAGSNVAVMILLTAAWIGWEAITRLPRAHPFPPVWTLWIAGGNAIVKEGLYRYQIAVARKTGSLAITSGAWDHRSDAFCSLAVLIGLGVVRVGGPAFLWADEAAALLVVLVIFWTAVGLLRQSADELMDAQADEGLIAEIRRVAMEVDGVLGVDQCWVRKSGLKYFADIHIEVDPQQTVAVGHRIGHRAKQRLQTQFPLLRDVLVHLEPFDQ